MTIAMFVWTLNDVFEVVALVILMIVLGIFFISHMRDIN